jgi:hypothetical protein
LKRPLSAPSLLFNLTAAIAAIAATTSDFPDTYTMSSIRTRKMPALAGLFHFVHLY